jgi:carbon storage regulator
MLVLTRKQNQSVHIGETIDLQVLEIQGSRVKIGISCPQGVKILRGELSVAKESDHCSGASPS